MREKVYLWGGVGWGKEGSDEAYWSSADSQS